MGVKTPILRLDTLVWWGGMAIAVANSWVFQTVHQSRGHTHRQYFTVRQVSKPPDGAYRPLGYDSLGGKTG